MKKIFYTFTILILLLSNISFGQQQYVNCSEFISNNEIINATFFVGDSSYFNVEAEEIQNEIVSSSFRQLSLQRPTGGQVNIGNWTGSGRVLLTENGIFSNTGSSQYIIRSYQNNCSTNIITLNVTVIEQSTPVIQAISSTDNVTLTVDTLSNKDRTHLLTLNFNQNHGFKYYYILTSEYKLCPDGFSPADTSYIFGSSTLARSTSPYTFTYSRTNKPHSSKIYYKVMVSDSTYNVTTFANTPQGINGNLTASHNTAYMLPMKITPDSTVNYDKKVKINIHSEWKDLSNWFNPPVANGQSYSTSSNNVGRWELWECNSSGQLLYPATQDGVPLTRNYFINNVFQSSGPQGNYGSDKLWSTPTIEVYQPCVKYYKIKSIEAFDSCNTSLSNLLTVNFTTPSCAARLLDFVGSFNTKAKFRYRFKINSICPKTGWEARFYKCNNGNGLLASNSSLSQIQVATLPLAKVQYKNVEVETLTSTRIRLTQTEINQGFFERDAFPKLIYGNSWYRIDIVCAGCSSIEKTKTMYVYVTN